MALERTWMAVASEFSSERSYIYVAATSRNGRTSSLNRAAYPAKTHAAGRPVGLSALRARADSRVCSRQAPAALRHSGTRRVCRRGPARWDSKSAVLGSDARLVRAPTVRKWLPPRRMGTLGSALACDPMNPIPYISRFAGRGR